MILRIIDEKQYRRISFYFVPKGWEYGGQEGGLIIRIMEMRNNTVPVSLYFVLKGWDYGGHWPVGLVDNKNNGPYTIWTGENNNKR